LLSGAITAPAFSVLAAQSSIKTETDADKERFLSSAKIISAEEIGHGVTKPLKGKLVLEGLEHAAQIQTVDKELSDFFPKDGGKPVPMRDCWRFNVAAYKIDRLLDMKMVAVTVARPYRGKPGALTWWVDDVMFEEVERVKRDLTAPNPEDFERQREVSRVFDELIINIDRNLANMLITKSWKIALIDHTRSFTPYHGIRNEENLTRCSRGLLAQLKALTQGRVTSAVGTHLTKEEVAALLARRDRIVAFFEKAVKEKGDEKVLFS
jgi:hypothetical protein